MKIIGRIPIAAVVLAGSSVAALAQVGIPGIEAPEATIPERQSVLQAPRPDYDPLGYRAGSFLILPSATASEYYNSNVYAFQHPVTSDYVFSLQPAIAINSNWNTNALNFLTTGELRRYANQETENETNFSAATNGRLDILRNEYITGGLGYQIAHEDRTNPNTVVNQEFPTEYQLATAEMGYVHEPGRLGYRIDGSINNYSYNNTITSTGAAVPETPRNRIEYDLTPRLSYEIVPGYHAFVKTPINDRDYFDKYDASGFKPSSDGYEVDAGTAVDLGHVMNGEIFAGYFKQYYVDPRFSSPGGITFGGNLLWNVTQLTSIRAGLAHSVQETTLQPASSYVQTAVALTAEHELLRNVLLNGGVSFQNQDYQGITRNDDLYGANVGGRYLLNRYVSATLDVSFSKRASNLAGDSYDQEIIGAGIRVQY